LYGLPADFDASAFVGSSLEQISFSANTVDMSFASDMAITAETTFVYSICGPPHELENLSPPVRESRVMRLIGETVRSAQGWTDGTLVLTFVNGDVLSFYDDTKLYESYRIRVGNHEFVI
jgi:hypothetical protein